MPENAFDPDDFLEVISHEDAISHVAFGHESPAARQLLEHRTIIDRPEMDRSEEAAGRHSLAEELLKNLAKSDRLRVFGRKTETITEEGGYETWGALGNYVRIPAEEIDQLEWDREEFEDDLLEGWQSDRVGYWDLLVALDDLIRNFPGRGFEAMRMPAPFKPPVEDPESIPVETKGNSPTEPPAPEPSSRPSGPTSGARHRCANWIRTKAEEGHIPTSRAAMFSQARQVIGPNLSERGFNAAWAEAAPEEWRTPGRKPRRDFDPGSAG